MHSHSLKLLQAPPSVQLLEAACAGNLSVVSSLLASGVDVNVVNESGNKPIHVAAYEGHVPVMQALLSAGLILIGKIA